VASHVRTASRMLKTWKAPGITRSSTGRPSSASRAPGLKFRGWFFQCGAIARPQLVNGLVNSVRQFAGSGLDSGPAM
jgi:hypothetical protein